MILGSVGRWWTLTPWYINDVGYGHYVRYITHAGYVSYYSATNSYGVAPACVFRLEALERELRELKVGDEFTFFGKVYVVTKTKDSWFVCIDKNGSTTIMNINGENIVKTGRHFPQVAELLKQMKE